MEEPEIVLLHSRITQTTSTGHMTREICVEITCQFVVEYEQEAR